MHLASISRPGECSVQEITLGRTVRALRLENETVAATILVDKGADIYELVYKPAGIDVLWKSPWGLRTPAYHLYSTFDSASAWLEAYPGGWQEIFPSGGGPCTYKGVELNFHGEASMIPWEYEIRDAGPDAVEIRLHTRLHRSPFRIERVMRLDAGRPDLVLRERITNVGGESMDYMWGHHPAYGAPFLDDACRIDVGAHTLWADDQFDGPANPLSPDARYTWPQAGRDGETTDMSRVLSQETPRHILGYFDDFDAGWYGITNTERGFGVGLVWPTDIYPYAWFWQEMHASAGFPWYKGAYVMAIEPFSSVPGQGLVTAMEKTETHRTLAAGDSVEAELRAVFYESSYGIEHIDPDGTVTVKEDDR